MAWVVQSLVAMSSLHEGFKRWLCDIGQVAAALGKSLRQGWRYDMSLHMVLVASNIHFFCLAHVLKLLDSAESPNS